MKKRLSQVISLTVIVAMLLSMASVTVFANNGYTINTGNGGLVPAGELLFEETFDGTGTYDTTTEVTFGDAGTLGNKTVKLSSGTAVEGDGVIAFGNASSSSKVTLAYKDDYIAKLATGTRTITFNFKIGDPSKNVETLYRSRAIGSTNIGANILYRGGSKFRAYYGTGSSTYQEFGAKAVADKWYTIKIIENWDTNTYDIWLDGEWVVKNLAFNGTDPTTTTTSHYLYELAVNTGQTFTIDDLRIYAEPAGRTTYAAENFEKYAAGTDLTAIPGLTNRTTLTANAVAVEDGKAMQVSKGQQVLLSGYEILAGSPTTSSSILTDRRKLGIAFDFSTADVSSSEEREIASTTDRNRANPGAKLLLKGSDIITYDVNGAKHIIYPNVYPNQKYHIEMYSDITAHTKVSDSEWTRQGTYSVYVDGVCRASGLDWRFHTALSSYQGAHNLGMAMTTDLKSVTAATTFTYDNIVIYTDEREEVMEDVMIAVKANAAAVKTGAATFALPASTKAGYTVSWASDSDTIAVDNGTAVVTYPDEAKKVTLTATVADANNEYAVSRKIWVNLPSKYDTELSAEDGVVTGTVTVNMSTVEGYNGGKAILAIYDSSDRVVDVKYIDAVDGTATVTSDKITEAGNYTAKLFFLNISNVKPFTKRIQPYSFEVK